MRYWKANDALRRPKSYVLGRDSFKSMGVDFADLNDDGSPDIYVSNITEPKGLQESQMLFVSTGDITTMQKGIAPNVNRSEALGLSDSGWAWDAKLDDFDNDGIPEALQATGLSGDRRTSGQSFKNSQLLMTHSSQMCRPPGPK